MAAIINRRVCAALEGEFVVFLIGARINKPWKFWQWGPVLAAMPRMLIELAKQPDLGLLHARNAGAEHLPAWRAFNKAVGSNGDVGIWHETFRVAPGAHESVYNNMPRYGLGLAGEVIDAVGARKEARQRMKAGSAAA